jgi:hypothetical protein
MAVHGGLNKGKFMGWKSKGEQQGEWKAKIPPDS